MSHYITGNFGDRIKVRVMRKFDLTDVHTMRSECQLVNPFLGLHSRYAKIEIYGAELGGVHCSSESSHVSPHSEVSCHLNLYT